MPTKIVVRKKKMPPERSLKKRKNTEERRRKQLQALELRQSGATYQMIADGLGLSDASHARKYVNAALDRMEIEAAKDVVRLDLTRLDEMQMRCTHALRQNGDLHQVDRILRLMEMRYRLLGISDETVRALQSEHGITTINNKNVVMNVMAAPETQEEFVGKMMRAVGIDPDSEEAKNYLSARSRTGDDERLPLPPGSANDAQIVKGQATILSDEEIEAEIVEEM